VKNPARLLAILSLAGLAACSAFDYSAMTSKRYALIYGVSTYDSAGTLGNPNLEYPDADAIDMSQMLAAKGFDEVRTRLSSNAPALRPTRANLLLDLAYFGSKAGPNDMFLFYFSGHGLQDATTLQGVTTTHEYILPYGAVVTDGFGGYTMDEANAVRDDQLAGLLSANLKTPRKVVILDSCNSGGFIGKGLVVDITPPGPPHPSPFQPAVTPAILAEAIGNYGRMQSSLGAGGSPDGVIVLSAAGADESSYEAGQFPDGTPMQHGVMTYYLLQAPQSGDLNGDGVVTVTETFALVKAGVDRHWNGAVTPDTSFLPHVSGGAVDFALF